MMKMLKEESGKLSFGRCMSGVIVVGVIVGNLWALKNGATVFADIPTNWSLLAGALFGITKAPSVVGK